jgi:hypothetical protein
LTSYDNRRDKIEETNRELMVQNVELKFEKEKNVEIANKAMDYVFENSDVLFNNIKKNKKALIDYSLISGFCLLLSLLSLILALSAPNDGWITFLSSVAVGLLFIGIFQIFWTMRDLGKDPCEQV